MNLSDSIKTFTMLSMLSLFPLNTSAADKTGDFTVGDKTFLLNGEPFIVKAAELHYPRIPRPYWEHRIKMCKALGMNTICLYVFWNIHEQTEGRFDFTGNNDVAAFCRLAQKNGMYVIVRPGPYVCAEWEMGGLPWWLLKKKDIRLREQDPYFMERVRIFEQKVGEQLAPLTIQNGGPIIMVQVENEYGSYGEDKAYVGEIRDIVKASGFDKVALFQCDWASNFTKNGLEDLIWTMNFGTGANIDEQFKRLGELRPTSPQMCSEFWSGWFDKWGAQHETRPAKAMVDGIDQMLSKGISFSLYMTHGGTSFGHWAGANSPGFAPDVTSYDYDAPINEYGHATEKYYELRNTLAKYNDGKKLPSVPKPVTGIITIPKFSLTEYAPLVYGADNTVRSRNVKTFEDMDMGWGTMIYSTELPQTKGGSILTLNECHDYALIYINGKYTGKINRVRKESSITLPRTNKGDILTIVLEGMGRINFGRAIKDYKGITGNVTMASEVDGDEVTWNLKDWTISTVPDDYATAIKALGQKNKNNRIKANSGYYRGFFNLKKTGDTFLNMEKWGKGQAYINGHALGRFWSIGPQQTLYIPGCWLKKGRNELVVLDIEGPAEAECHAQDRPELNKLNKPTEKKKRNAPDLKSMKPVAKGSFSNGNGWQKVSFPTAKGCYLAIECLNAHDGGNIAAIAELYAVDNKSKRMSREAWTSAYTDSDDAKGGNHTADKVYDLQESTYWSTAPSSKFPHVIVIDLGAECELTGIEYLPRAEQGAPAGTKDYRIYVY
ncbi:beta-galactosidase [Xylanibacter muris]|uniref:Beta-galactosidase n=1 Tax=Xylanibacter muris TaxID=2736290 RepID=A0ABX2AQI1_9BACT|nr:beta-galactosidase [Xylanibacter muris]